MVRFFTQMCPTISATSNTIFHQCLSFTKGKLVPMTQIYNPHSFHQSRTFAEGPGKKKTGKEEITDSVKMPGFVHPQNKNEEGYFTHKARQQLEELKKQLDKPKVENTDGKD